MSAAHKLWKVGSILLLLLLATHFTTDGFFRQKSILTDVTPSRITPSKSDRKVILLMVDALREDFVEFDTNTPRYLDLEAPYAYDGWRMRLFKDLMDAWPERTMMFPLVSEMPTVTIIRIKSILTGALTSLFDLSEEFESGQVTEDSVLQQLHQRKGD